MNPGPLSLELTQPTTLTTTATAYKGFLVGDIFTFYILQKVLELVNSGPFLIEHFSILSGRPGFGKKTYLHPSKTLLEMKVISAVLQHSKSA